MNRIVKAFCKVIWRLSSPIRRPLAARFDARVANLVAGTVHNRVLPELIHPLSITLRRLERIEETLARADRSAAMMAEEVDLVLNGLSREIFRLQAQVETLQSFVGDDLRGSNTGLSIVHESGDESPVRRVPGSERSMVG